MPLALRFTSASQLPLELDGILPERVQALSQGAIEKLLIRHGNRLEPLAEHFAISGSIDDGTLIFESAMPSGHGIGTGMTAGVIRVVGHAGRRIGAQMRGGRIEVEGSAGDLLGQGMSGGRIAVTGDAGDHVAGPLPGSRRGMTGGVITIAGSVGAFAAAGMRRGLVAIGQSAGAGLGYRMIAGTLVVQGPCAPNPGLEMKRGSIVLLDRAIELAPTFRKAGAFRPVFLRLLARELASLNATIDIRAFGMPLDLFHGDLLTLGKGEIWTRAGALASETQA